MKEFEELIMEWAESASVTLSPVEHEERANAYEKQAKHYEDLAREARRHATTHRELAKR